MRKICNKVRDLIDDDLKEITQALVTKLQSNKDIGEITENDCNISFEKYSNMEFVNKLYEMMIDEIKIADEE